LDELADRMEDFAEDFRSKSAVDEFQGDESRWCLRKTPVYIQEFLKGNVYKNVPRMFFTSATLRINGTSDFIESELGSDDANITTTRECLASPFNLKSQVYCAVDTSIHPYDYYQITAYRDSVKEAIADYVLSIDGRTLVLFMSHMELSYTYNQLEPRFIDAGILPIRQNGTSLDKIEEFRRVEESVLFGVDRFWAGVDFPGSTLSQVIIVKAPNPALSNPVITHRRLFEDDFMNSTYGHIGAMKIRQGFGRLIRKMDDRGAVIILDSRYQARFQDHLENLPVLPEFSENRQEIMKNVTMVMKNKTFSTIK